MRNVCLAHDFLREPLVILWSYPHVQLESPDNVCIFLPCLRSQSWLYIYLASVEFSDKVCSACLCLECPQSEPLICVPDGSASLTISMLISMYEECSVISATHALFTYGHEMLVQSF